MPCFHTGFKSLSVLSVACVLAGYSAPARANEVQLIYNLAAGATSPPFTVPGANTPVSMSCTQNNAGYRGIGQATILRVYPPAFLEWIGSDIATAGAPTVGFTDTPGTHIIYCDYTKNVDLQVSTSTAIQLKNNNSVPMAGVVNFVW